jgi:drug/metabolite transporter (DMT)-like permease
MQIPNVLRARWFWCCVFCVACWVPWAIFSKLGSEEIPAPTMQYLFTWGGVPVGLAVLVMQRFRIEKSRKGIFFGLMVGILSGAGQLALFAAYGTGHNAAIITTATSLYPLVTVMLALPLLRERLTKAQLAGLGFAAAALVIFSFQ